MIALPPSPAAVTAPSPAPAVIRPVAGRRYRLTSEDDRDDGTVHRRFMQTTDLVFRPERDGWLAELTLLDHRAEPAGDDAAARFVAGLQPRQGHTVTLHLDAGGRVVAIDDEDTAWAAVVSGIETMADRKPSQRLTLARDPAAPLRTLGPDARRAMIATPLRLAVPARPPWGTHAVALPGLVTDEPPMTGTQIVTEEGATIHDRTTAFRAAGDHAQSLVRDRTIDAGTGLLCRSVEIHTARIGDRVRTARRTDTLVPVP